MRFPKLIRAIALALIAATGAHAQSTVGPGAYATYPATVGTSDSTIIPAGQAFMFLDIVNNSPTATICLNFGAAATISTTTCAAGEVTIPPLWHRSWENNFVPNDAIHAISSAAATPVTVGNK